MMDELSKSLEGLKFYDDDASTNNNNSKSKFYSYFSWIFESNKKKKQQRPEQLHQNALFESFDLAGISKVIKKSKKIVVMTGAGISVAAGIPDFRSPGTGLYHQLSKYNLPSPEAIFTIDFFKKNPAPFCKLAKEMYPGKYKPTAVHYFIKLLEQKGILLRNYTQNIDTLERVAGISNDSLVEAHGSFSGAHCAGCRKEYPLDLVKDALFRDEVPYCKRCGAPVKPDITFFGEALPARFSQLCHHDLGQCDLLIVIGTSLQVYPFASLVGMVDPTTPRVLINNVMVNEGSGGSSSGGGFMGMRIMGSNSTFDFRAKFRDCAYIGDCQEAVVKIAELLGWKEELEQLISGSVIATPVPDETVAEQSKQFAEEVSASISSTTTVFNTTTTTTTTTMAAASDKVTTATTTEASTTEVTSTTKTTKITAIATAAAENETTTTTTTIVSKTRTINIEECVDKDELQDLEDIDRCIRAKAAASNQQDFAGRVAEYDRRAAELRQKKAREIKMLQAEFSQLSPEIVTCVYEETVPPIHEQLQQHQLSSSSDNNSDNNDCIKRVREALRAMLI